MYQSRHYYHKGVNNSMLMKYMRISLIVSVILMVFLLKVLYQEETSVPRRFLYLYEYPNKDVHYPGIQLAEKKMECFPDDTVTVQSHGDLRNQILEYASVWSIARLYGLKPFVPEAVINRLDVLFQGLSVPTEKEFLKNKTSCAVKDGEGNNDIIGSMQKVDQNIYPLGTIVETARRTHRIIVLEENNELWETIVPLASQLHEEFHYKPELVDAAQRSLSTFRDQLLNGENDSRGGQVVYVGIHVRRTGYGNHMRILYNITEDAGVDYYRNAVHWMRNTLWEENEKAPLSIVFVVASDDPDWCKEVLIPALISVDLEGKKQEPNLSDNMGKYDVFWGSQGDLNTPEQDLVLLSSCNHSIYAYGTYGLWGALMAGGKAVVYDISGSEANRHVKGNTPPMVFAEHIDNWIVLS